MSRWATIFRLMGVGWYIGICIVLGTLGGLWLDRKFGTSPILVIAGLVLGTIVAGFGTYRMIKSGVGDGSNER